MNKSAVSRAVPKEKYQRNMMKLANETVAMTVAVIEKFFRGLSKDETPLEWGNQQKAFMQVLTPELNAYIRDAIKKAYVNPGEGFAEDLTEVLRVRRFIGPDVSVVWYWVLGQEDLMVGFQFQRNALPRRP